MADTFYIKQNDTSPALIATLKDSGAVVINLTGATTVFKMRNVSGVIVSLTGTNSVDAPATGGIARFTFSAADTATVGRYQGEFQVTFGDGSVETFPNKGYIGVKITDDIA